MRIRAGIIYGGTCTTIKVDPASMKTPPPMLTINPHIVRVELFFTVMRTPELTVRGWSQLNVRSWSIIISSVIGVH